MAPVVGVPPGLFSVVSLQGPLDLLVRALLIAVDGLGVEAEQDCDAVACPACDFCRGDAGRKPERDARVMQRVRHIRQGEAASDSVSTASRAAFQNSPYSSDSRPPPWAARNSRPSSAVPNS
jgi:hypothetical protein